MFPGAFFSRSRKLKRRRTAAKPLAWRSGLVPRRPRTFERLEDRLMLTTLVVNNPTDSTLAAELSLRQAVAQANTDAAAGTSDTITFDPSLGSGTITLASDLELSGAGTGTITIDGSSPSTPLTIEAGEFGSRIFLVDSGVNVVLTNLNLQESDLNDNAGGAILNAGTLTVSNTTVSRNEAYGNSAGAGGAIENTGSLVLSNNVFSDNSASGNGGAVDNNGGSVTVSDCTFTGDSALNGGAISNENQGTLTVSGSTFSNNATYRIGASGGAIENVSATATLDNDIFSKNRRACPAARSIISRAA